MPSGFRAGLATPAQGLDGTQCRFPSRAHSFVGCPRLLLHYKAGLSGYDRDGIALKFNTISYMSLYRKGLPIPALEFKGNLWALVAEDG